MKDNTPIFLRFVICVIMTYCTANSYAQQDTAIYVTIGGVFEDGFNSVIVDNDSNLVLCGYTSSKSEFGSQAYIVKTDSLMNVLWSATYAESASASFEEVVLHDNGYITVGKLLNADSSYDILVALFSLDGELLWDKHLGGDDWDLGNSISAISGGFLISGETYSFSENADAYACKIDDAGSVIWEKTYATAANESFNDGRETGSGALIFGGEIKLDSEFSKQWFLLADENGNTILEREYGEEGKNAHHAVLADPIDETYFVLGEILNTNSGLTNGTITRLDALGEIIWRDTLAVSTGSQKWINAELGRSNQIICTGTILEAGFGNLGTDFLVKRITRTNIFVSQHTYGTNSDDDPTCSITIPNGYVSTGRTNGLGQGQHDGFIIRTRNSGLDTDHATAEILGNEADFYQGVESVDSVPLFTFYSETNELLFSAQVVNFSVLDLTGKLIENVTLTQSKVQLSLPPGIYLVMVNGLSDKTEKIVVR